MKLQTIGWLVRTITMPRPRLNPTPEQRRTVKSLAAFGVTHDAIAKSVGIRSSKTLRKHFRNELDRGGMDACAMVAQALLKKAKDGDTRAAIFWLKSRAGWRDRDRPSFDLAGVAPPPFIVTLQKRKD